MQARMKTQNEIVVVYLSGRVDVETAEPFRAACLSEFQGKRLVFDYTGLSFVGSQGILPFLETFQAFYERAPGSFKFSGVGVEFRKLFAATPLSVVEIYDTPDQATRAFYMPVSPNVAPAVELAPLAPTEYISYRSEPTALEAKLAETFEVDDELDV